MIWLVAAALADPLSYEDALAVALREGVDVRRAALTLAEADAIVRGRQRQWDPAVTASAAVTVSAGGLGAGATPGVAAGAQLLAESTLWEGGAGRARLSAARADRASAEAALEAGRQATVLAVAEALVAVEEARATVAVQRSLLDAELATARRVDAQVAAGARTRADALQQAAAVAAARAGLVEAERARLQADLDAALLLRLDATRDWTFSGPTAAPTVEGDVHTLRDRAWTARPDLAVARAEVDAAAAVAREAAAGRWPTLGANAGVSTDDAWAGLEVRVPVLDRGATREAKARAEVGEGAAALELAALSDAVAAQVRGAMTARDAARETLAAAEAQRDAATAALAVVQQRYDAGAALFVELAAARAASVEGERAVALARADGLRTGFALAWAVGEL